MRFPREDDVSEALVNVPVGGWTTADLDELPESNRHCELTDGALTVSPSPTNLHQWIMTNLARVLEGVAPEGLVVAVAVEIRFGPQLTRVPDVLVVRSDEPGRRWFAPEEVVLAAEVESEGSHVEDRTTKPAIYAQCAIPHYWRLQQDAPAAHVYRLGDAGSYELVASGDRIRVTEPFAFDAAIADLRPRWAR
jgi:Uma2 family endonuclease